MTAHRPGPSRIDRADDEEDQDIRAYVSKLWAEDWNSPEDTIYDEIGEHDD